MKNKLLLTTALIAFAMPALAGNQLYTYEGDQGKVSVENKTNNDTWDSYIVYVPGKVSIASESSFTNNHAGVGGAITIAKKTGEITIGSKTVFDGNKADYDGGAIGNYAGAIVANDVEFLNNQAQLNASTDNGHIGGGAISLGIDATLDLTSGYFENNTSGFNGGAIATRRTLQENEIRTSAENHFLKINSSTFIGNKATGSVVDTSYGRNEKGGNGGAIANYFKKAEVLYTTFKENHADNNGGAIYNAPLYDVHEKKIQDTTGKMTITDGTFTSNTASSGGAIFNSQYATINLKGANTFSSNKAGSALNDIHNDGTLNVEGQLILDGGITGNGVVNFEKADLTATLDTTKIVANTVNITDSTLNLILGDNVKEGSYEFITATTQEGVFSIENALYNITHETDGSITVANKSSSEVEKSLGVTRNEASALEAVLSGSSNNENFNNVISALSKSAQAGDKTVAKELAKLGADTNPVVASQERSSVNMLFNVVSNELNGDTSALGRASGDFFKKATAWVRGLFNKADHEATSKSAGFNADTYGVAFGIDKEVNNNTRLGFGYAFSQTDIESAGRDTDVDTNTLFVYSKYQPAKWYINSMLGYSWSSYDEKKSVAGYAAGTEYDVDTIALQSMFGYEAKIGNHNVTPEFGFRYLRVEKDSYKDGLGTSVDSSSEDILTAVLATKVAKDYRLDNGAIVRPELRVAVTYDVMEADNTANVLLANGASYNVNGEKLDRLGFELGAKVTTYATDNVEISAGAQTSFRDDYQDYSFTFDAKYNF